MKLLFRAIVLFGGDHGSAFLTRRALCLCEGILVPFMKNKNRTRQLIWVTDNGVCWSPLFWVGKPLSCP